MRGKRSKQYRKLMQQYDIHFGFRQPYQLLVDAAVLQDAVRFKMNFGSMIQKTLHGEVKIMITQCSMRHLYEATPKDESLIEHAKQFERRRCNHHELDKPLSTLECFKDVIDPKSSRTNKHRYVVACQDPGVRAYLRTIPGVPLIYLKRSVMILEPMAGTTEAVREREEQAKFSLGLKGRRNPGTTKRKRDEDDEGDVDGDSDDADAAEEKVTVTPKKSIKRARGPNPLSVKKKSRTNPAVSQTPDASKKRRRKHKPTVNKEEI